MANGSVTTARGDVLNFDALQDAASRPLGIKDAKSEIAPKARQPVAINVRGFVPAQGDAEAPVLPEVKVEQGSKVNPHQTTLADMTAIKMDEPRHLKEKPEDALAASDEALGSIMKQLETDTHPEGKSPDEVKDS